MSTSCLTDGRRVVITTGCIGMKTLMQGIGLGLLGGPFVWFLEGDWSMFSFFWDIVAMFAAPFVVDLIRPVVRIQG